MASVLPHLDPALVHESSDWLPDLFVVLWSDLERWVRPPEDEGRYGLGEAVWTSTSAREYSEICRLIRESDTAAVPPEIVEYLTNDDTLLAIDHCDAPFHQRPYVVARAIDAELDLLSPWMVKAVTTRGGLREILQHFNTASRFNRRDAHAILLPTSRHWHRRVARMDPERPVESTPARLDVHFSHLAVYRHDPARSWTMEYRWIPWRSRPLAPTPRPLRVGLVPLAEGKDDLDITTSDDDGVRWFTVAPGVAEPALEKRAAEAVHQLARNAVDLAIFPELAVSPAVARAVQEALHALPRTHPAADPPQLVVAGSGLNLPEGANLPFNECSVFSETGACAWTQRKLNAFSMRGKDLDAAIAASRNGRDPHDDDSEPVKGVLAPAVNTQLAYRERIRVGTKVVVADGCHGRMVVLICEDLSQADPKTNVCDLLHPDWVFSPVMDTEFGERRWTTNCASTIGRDHSCHVVVANSLTLSEAIDPIRWPTSANPRGVGIGVCVDPGHPHAPSIVKVTMPRANDREVAISIFDWDPPAWHAV